MMKEWQETLAKSYASRACAGVAAGLGRSRIQKGCTEYEFSEIKGKEFYQDGKCCLLPVRTISIQIILRQRRKRLPAGLTPPIEMTDSKWILEVVRTQKTAVHSSYIDFHFDERYNSHTRPNDWAGKVSPTDDIHRRYFCSLLDTELDGGHKQ